MTLVKKGADITERDCIHSTPLHYAASKKNFNIVSILVQNGAKVGAWNASNSTPLHYAVAN